MQGFKNSALIPCVLNLVQELIHTSNACQRVVNLAVIDCLALEEFDLFLCFYYGLARYFWRLGSSCYLVG